jgi:hypothetical protein
MKTISLAAVKHVAADVSVGPCLPDPGPLHHLARVVMSSGALHAQTYASAAELRELAHAFTVAADQLELRSFCRSAAA